MTNCPNCGSPIEPYKCKCEYCGTYYFDFTAFDMTENVPYFVKFRTPYGIVTTLARPELQAIDVYEDDCYCCNPMENKIVRFARSRNCDLNVVFHSQVNPENGTLYTLDTNGVNKGKKEA